MRIEIVGSTLDFSMSDFGSTFLQRRKEFAFILKEKSYKTGEFILASGQKSDYYLDCRITSLSFVGAKYIGYLFNEIIDKFKPYYAIQGVAGMTMGADPLVTATSLSSFNNNWFVNVPPLNGLIVRKKAKDHGTTQWVEGIANFGRGDNVIMLEDVITTGGSLLQACEKVRDAGLNIVACLSIMDRLQGGSLAIREAGYSYISLFTIDSFRDLVNR